MLEKITVDLGWSENLAVCYPCQILRTLSKSILTYNVTVNKTVVQGPKTLTKPKVVFNSQKN